MNYSDFLEAKLKLKSSAGIEVEKLNKHLFDFQKFIVKKALSAGKYG